MSNSTTKIRRGTYAAFAAIACLAGVAPLVTVAGCGEEEVIDDRPPPNPDTPPPYGGNTTGEAAKSDPSR